MNDIILNEKSLNGQYSSMDEFYHCIPEFLACVSFFMKNETWNLSRKSDLFDAQITKNQRFFQIRGDRSDEARKLKQILCRMTDDPPYWDDAPKQAGEYYFREKCVTGTSLAEASARTGFVLSFPKSDYTDCNILIRCWEQIRDVSSLTTNKYRNEMLYQKGYVDIYTYLKERFHGTRLNFEKMDQAYGFDSFEKSEIEECIRDFERFARHKDWDAVLSDRSLHYKEYQPSKKNNWFKGTDYEDVTIDKFRCGNPKRCFGFRKEDVFYVLRMERDHSISNYG